MSKKMTPCEKLGYKVGDKFKVVDGTGVHYAVGSFITLIHDDGSSCPRFNGVHAIFESGDSFFPLDFVEKVAKLKPAKQALADAIHQNGGWPVAGDSNFATSNRSGVVKFFNQNPLRNGADWVSCPYSLSWIVLHQQLPNWHQCILSRDEYLTAYPEQVKVVVNNETKHKVEVEMKSESEATINASDWHKNGELPPVGEVVMINSTIPNDYWAHHVGAELTVVAHDKDVRGGDIAVYRFVRGDGYNEYHGLIAHAFKPLRTEREKAIDEMVDVITDGRDSPLYVIKIATRLYEAGYRKEVK